MGVSVPTRRSTNEREESVAGARAKASTADLERAQRSQASSPSSYLDNPNQREKELMRAVVKENRGYNKLGDKQKWEAIRQTLPAADVKFLEERSKQRVAGSQQGSTAENKGKGPGVRIESAGKAGLLLNYASVNMVDETGRQLASGKRVSLLADQLVLYRRVTGTSEANEQYAREALANRSIDRDLAIGLGTGKDNRTSLPAQGRTVASTSNASLEKLLATLPANPSNQQVFNAIHRHYGSNYDKTFSGAAQRDFGIDVGSLTKNRDAAFSGTTAIAQTNNRAQAVRSQVETPVQTQNPQDIINHYYKLAGVSGAAKGTADGFDKAQAKAALMGAEHLKAFNDALRARAANN